MKQVLSALRAIAGNDDVKDAIVTAGGTELIVMAINRHMANAQVGLITLQTEITVCVIQHPVRKRHTNVSLC